MLFRFVASSFAAAVTAAAAMVNIAGLALPTSVTWDDAGRVYISEQAGLIRIAQNFSASSASVLLDLRNQTAFFGDLGVESVAWAGGYLYASYMTSNLTSCSDDGTPNGRNNSQIIGCLAYGRLSRWPVRNGVVMGPEQRIIDETTRPNICNQFRKGPIDGIIAGTDGFIYAAAGSGANSKAIDYGQFGTNPCGTGATWGGAFRSQDLQSLDGKFFRINVTTGAIEVLARGFNNPYRFTVGPDGIYVGDTGSDTYEEINGPIPFSNPQTGANSLNFGFPCYEATNPLTGYQALNTTVCNNLSPATVKAPIYAYGSPDGVTRVVISSLAYDDSTDRFYYGDYMQNKLFSIRRDGTGVKVEKTNCYPVDIKQAPNYGLVYVDVALGSVKSVPAYSSGAMAYSVLGLIISVLAIFATQTHGL